MFHNNSNNTTSNNEQISSNMPGGMPGGMPGSIPQENTQFNQQGNAGLNDHTGQRIVGGPNKIQAGLNQAMSNEHNVNNNNNSLGHNNVGFTQNPGLNDSIARDPLHNSHETIPSNVDGHRELQSHHKGLGNLESNHGLPGAAGSLANHELNNQHSPLTNNNTQQTHFGGVGPNSTSHNDNHHYGRDAALGAGAAGLAKHELGNHQNSTSNPLHNDQTNTSGLHGNGLGNHQTDPLHTSGRDANPLRTEHSPISGTHNTNDNHHYGRDAALGAGAAGLAKHELDNRHNNSHSDPLNNNHGSNPLTHNSRTEQSPISGTHDNNNGNHHGRNAALGAGAAGLAKHELDNHRNNGDHLNNTHSSNPLTQDSRAEHSPISGTHNGNNETHHGRNAALGAGAAGLAKHELDNHHNNGDHLNNTHSSNPLTHDSRTEHSPISGTHNGNNETHHGRNAALGAGAAGLAKHELDNHHNSNDHLKNTHGSNPLTHDSRTEHSPISGTHNDNNETHHGRNAALGAGAAGLAKHEYDNHRDRNNGDHLDNTHSSNPLTHDSRGEHSPISGTHNGNNETHHARNAALGAGAAGLAKHELDNHHKNNDHLNNTHGSNPLTHDGRAEHSPISSTHNNTESHHGRDAALGAGAAGVAGREIKHHHDEKKRESVGSAHSNKEGEAAGGKKPLNTGGDAHHIAEQPLLYTDGGLTGHQPVGEVKF